MNSIEVKYRRKTVPDAYRSAESVVGNRRHKRMIVEFISISERQRERQKDGDSFPSEIFVSPDNGSGHDHGHLTFSRAIYPLWGIVVWGLPAGLGMKRRVEGQ